MPDQETRTARSEIRRLPHPKAQPHLRSRVEALRLPAVAAASAVSRLRAQTLGFRHAQVHLSRERPSSENGNLQLLVYTEPAHELAVFREFFQVSVLWFTGVAAKT